MFGKYFWILFILYGVWQAIGSRIDKAGKKQQLKTLTEQQQRQPAARSGRPAGAGLSGGGAADPRAAGVADRLEGLAARRKAQLEELRRRRTPGHTGTAKQGSPVAVELQPTRAPMTTTRVGQQVPLQRAPQPVPTARSAHPASRVPRQPPVPPTTAPPPTPPTRRRAPTETATQRVVTPKARRREQPEPQLDPHSVFLHTKKVTTERAGRRPPVLPDGRPIDRALLRKMVIYRELLDPPLALRGEQVWER